MELENTNIADINVLSFSELLTTVIRQGSLSCFGSWDVAGAGLGGATLIFYLVSLSPSCVVFGVFCTFQAGLFSIVYNRESLY